MPPYNNIISLEVLALNQVCKNVLSIIPEMKRNGLAYREYFIDNVHAWARTDILNCTKDKLVCLGSSPALNNIQIKKWLVIANTMLDIGVDRLPHLFLYQEELHTFFSVLHDYKTHLKKLSVTFQKSDGIYMNPETSKSMITLQKSLCEGLASTLVSLVLVGICDTSILKVIGEHTLCLKHLDVSRSWDVNDIGIKHLLFKSKVCVVKVNTPIDAVNRLCQNLDKLYYHDSLLNRCCFTLEELRIQDTHITNDSLLMILACVKNLKSLGKFLQFKNIGDALVTLKEKSSIPRIFQLTELYDTELTNKKINIFNECLPHLKILYTGYSCVGLPQDIISVEQGSMFWGRVHTLTIDLDYILNIEFLNFLFDYGRNLSELTILDQEADIDVSKLLTSCPNLLSLKGYFHILDTPVGQFTRLKSIELHTPVFETINWFFENCPCLEDAMLHGYSRNEDRTTELFDSSSVNMCTGLKKLEISFSKLYPMIDLQTVIKFIDKCSSLQHLGRLHGWNLSFNSITEIETYIKTKNYDLHIY